MTHKYNKDMFSTPFKTNIYHQFQSTTNFNITKVRNIGRFLLPSATISIPSNFPGYTIMIKTQNELQWYLKTDTGEIISWQFLTQTGWGDLKVKAPRILNSGTKGKSRTATIKYKVGKYTTNISTTWNKNKVAH